VAVDPRDIAKRTGVDPVVYTYDYDSTIVFDNTLPGKSAAIGLAVCLTGDGIVGLTTDGVPIEGQLIAVDDDFCSVQVEGVVTLPAGASATVTAGKKPVGALGAASAKGYIRNAAAGAESENAHGRIIDASVATAVEVDL
jgi:hypothetical protein